MGFEVEVPCRCYLEGRATREPPSAVRWQPDGGYFEPLDREPARRAEVLDWSRNHCEHAGGLLAGGWLARTFQMEPIREFAAEAGCHLLAETLPAFNGGWVEPDECAGLLPELARFRLVEVATSQVVDGDDSVVESATSPGLVDWSRTARLYLRGGWLQVTPDDHAPATWRSKHFMVEGTEFRAAVLIDHDTSARSAPAPVPQRWPRGEWLTSRIIRETPPWLTRFCDTLIECCEAAVTHQQRMYWG